MPAWTFLRVGSCDYCTDDDVRLYAPRLAHTHAVTAPAFCSRCRLRFEQQCARRQEEAPANTNKEPPDGDR